MTAFEYRWHELMCNSPQRHDDPKAGFFQVPDGDDKYAVSRAKLRTLAAKAGWTHVRSDSGRRFDKDYCPAHKAEADEAMAQRARRNALRDAS